MTDNNEESSKIEENISFENQVSDHSNKKPMKINYFRYVMIGIMIFSLALGGSYIGVLWALNNNLIDDGTTVLYQAADRVIDKLGSDHILGELSIQEIAAFTADSVVEIKTEQAAYSYFMQEYVTSGSGSGVILTQDGYIITCYHVIANATKITVYLNSGAEYDATLIGQDADNDIAILKINDANLTPVILGDSKKMVVGDTVVAVGNPLGELGGTVTSGILSALDREITIDGTKMNLLQTNAAVNPGNSGGALFNAYGELIGIINAKSSGNSIEGLGFAIPIDTIKDKIEQIIEQGYVTGKRALGITIVDINDDRLKAQYEVEEYGIYITGIEKDSVAQAEGFMLYDRIIAINNIEITTIAELQQLYKNCIAGEEVTFKIVRSGNEKNISFIRE